MLDVIETYVDILINLLAILMAYFFNITLVAADVFFHEGWDEIIPLSSPYCIAIIMFQLLVSSFIYHAVGLYRPTRYHRNYHSLPMALKANLVYYGMLAVVVAVMTRPTYREFILFWVMISFVLSTAFLTFKRHLIKSILAVFRTKQYNLRKIIVVGDNTSSAEEYIKQVTSEPGYGAMVLGYVGDKIDRNIGAEKLGPFTKLSEILDKYKPTDVVFAIDSYDKRHLIRLVNMYSVTVC